MHTQRKPKLNSFRKSVSTGNVSAGPFSPEIKSVFIWFLCLLTNQLVVTFRIDDLDVFCMNPMRWSERVGENEKETTNDMAFE